MLSKAFPIPNNKAIPVSVGTQIPVTYKTKAINSGTFTVPPMFAESMYNKDIRALSVYKPIIIIPAK